MNNYKIVFTGKITDGFEIDSVKEDFSHLFNIQNTDTMSKIFSGKPIAIKSELSKTKALEVFEILTSIGLIVEVQSPEEEEPGLATLFQQLPDTENKLFEVSALATIFDKLPDSEVVDFEEPTLATSFDKLPDAIDEPSLATVFEKLSDGGTENIGTDSVIEERNSQKESSSLLLSEDSELEKNTIVSSTQSIDSAALEAAALYENNNLSIGEKSLIPSEVKGFCWGGFFLTFFWALKNRVYIGLLALIPVVNIFIAVYLLFKGRELAWQKGNWPNIEAFEKSERLWSWAGWVFSVSLIVMISLIY